MATRSILAAGAVLWLALISAPPARAADDRVKQALDARGLTYEVTDQGNYRLTLPATNGRTQIVIIQSATFDLRGFEIREVWSPIIKRDTAPDADLCNKLLRDNNLDKAGAWQLYQSEGTHMVTFCSKVPAAVDPESLESFILGVVEIADDMELQVTGTDEF